MIVVQWPFLEFGAILQRERERIVPLYKQILDLYTTIAHGPLTVPVVLRRTAAFCRIRKDLRPAVPAPVSGRRFSHSQNLINRSPFTNRSDLRGISKCNTSLAVKQFGRSVLLFIWSEAVTGKHSRQPPITLRSDIRLLPFFVGLPKEKFTVNQITLAH